MESRCPECGSLNSEHESFGEQFCKDCGIVLEDASFEQPIIDYATKSKATLPFLAVAGSKGMEGKVFKSIWMLSSREKNLQTGINQIDELASKLSLPEFVIKESKHLFKKSLYSNIAIGRDNLSLIYASVYLACIINEIPKTLLELTVYSDIEEKQVIKAVKLIKNKLEIKTSPIDPMDLLSRFASKLKLKPETVTKIIDLLVKLKGTKIIEGRKPETILAGVIYLICKQNNDERTQRQIANTMGVIEITIRKISKKISQILI